MMSDDAMEMSNEPSIRHWPTIVILSLAVLFFLQGARELIGTIYNFNLSTMAINITIVAVFAFMSPALYLLGLKRINQRNLMLFFGFMMAISRIIMSSGPDATTYLASSFVLVSSALIFIASISYSYLEITINRETQGRDITLAVLIAIALDLVFRGAGNSFDISIYGLTELRATSLLISGPLVALFFYCALWLYTHQKRPQAADTEYPPSLPFLGINMGILLFLYMVFSGYPNCSAGWVTIAPLSSYMTASGALIIFIVLFYLPGGRKFMLGELGLMIFEAILAITFMTLFIDPSGSLAGALLPASILPLAVIFYNNINTFLAWGKGKNRVPTNMFLVGIVFVVLVFLSVLTLTWAHVPGTAFLKDKMGLLALMAVLVCIMSTHVFWKLGNKYNQSISDFTPANAHSIFAVFCIFMLICTSIFSAVYSDQARSITLGDNSNVTVMTYNIHQGYGMDGVLDPWEILNTIREINPDILVLQESETNRLSSMNVDILNWLAYKLEMYVYYGPSTGEQIYGLALLSRYTIEESSLHSLESIEDQRIKFRCQVRLGAQALAVYGIHMGLSHEDRISQSNEVIERLANETMPFIIMGDFNTWPNETIYSNLTGIIHDAWILTGHELNGPPTYTFDSAAPYERIDYIFVSDELVPSVISCDVMTGQLGSDHLPVWAELNIG